MEQQETGSGAAVDRTPARSARDRVRDGDLPAGALARVAAGLEAAFPRSEASRDVVVVAGVLIGLSRLVDGPLVWLVMLCAMAAVALATLQVLGESDAAAAAVGIPVEHLVLPAIATAASIGLLRLVPFGVLLVPALGLLALLVARTLATEARLVAAPTAPGEAERTAVMAEVILVAFAGFAGSLAVVHGGLPEPSAGALAAPPDADLAMLAVADAGFGLLLGFRAGALRIARTRDVLWFAFTTGVVVAIAAAATRVMEVPRVAGPALLTLVFFLWVGVHGTPPSRRRNVRWIWEMVLLGVLAVVVLGWTRLLGS